MRLHPGYYSACRSNVSSGPEIFHGVLTPSALISHLPVHIIRGAEMAGYGEHGQPTGQAAGMRAEPAAEESARRAWAKPVVRRFSLQRTLAGSGVAFDAGGTHTAPSPT